MVIDESELLLELLSSQPHINTAKLINRKGLIIVWNFIITPAFYVPIEVWGAYREDFERRTLPKRDDKNN
tara:strand:+ start:32481 stop:32690 length:210 start_codon:yes stop_codon:yes gene_type:complete